MARNRSKNFRVESGVGGKPPRVDLGTPVARSDDKAAVNLRYYDRKSECISTWQKDELKAFSGWVEKMCARTEAQVTSTVKTCHAHKNSPLSLPSEISPDVKIYSLDVGSKARVHGFFAGGKFFLVRLDRSHEVLKV